MKSPLTEQQKERLRKLEQDIQVGKITSSFSIEGRDAAGCRRSTFFSASVSSKGVDGWSTEEEPLVACLLAKRVVKATYRDAVHRGILPMAVAKEELPGVMKSYDAALAALLEGGPSGGPESEAPAGVGTEG